MRNKRHWWKYLFPFCFILLSFLILYEGSLSGKESSFRSRTFASLLDFGRERKPILPTSLSLKEEYSLYVGESVSLEPVVLPKDASDGRVLYDVTSGNDFISLSGNRITAKKEGQAEVLAECLADESVRFAFSVHVMEKKISSLSFSLSTEDEIVAGMTSRMVVKSDKPDFSLSDVLFSTSDESVAAIDKEGYVRTYRPGKVRLSIISKDDPEISFSSFLSVKEGVFHPVREISYEPYMNTYVNEKSDIVPKFNEDASDKAFRIIGRKGKLRISGSQIISLSVGEHEFEIQSISDPTKTFSVRVVAKEVKAKSIELKTSLIRCGETKKFSYQLISESAQLPVTDTGVSLSSSNPEIADFDSYGYLTGKRKGSFTVTAVWKRNPDIRAIMNVSVTLMATDAFSRLDAVSRKLVGHFGSFFVLAVFGVLTIVFFVSRGKKRIISSSVMIGYGAVLAALSEILQLLTTGRSGNFKDVMIDFSGYLLGYILCMAMVFLYERRHDPKKILTKELIQ